MRNKIALGLLGLLMGGMLMTGAAHALSPFDRHQLQRRQAWEHQQFMRYRANQIAQARWNRFNPPRRHYNHGRWNNWRNNHGHSFFHR